MTPTTRDLRIARIIGMLTLPSGLWRVALVLGLPVMDDVSLRLVERVQIFALSLLAEAVALLCTGLARPWGERVPSWVPVLGGRSLPVSAVVIPAGIGSVLLTVLWTGAMARVPFVGFYDYFSAPWARVLVTACYLPLLAWGPLLAVLTVGYRRRRGNPQTSPPLARLTDRAQRI